jgi:hypothetical protein
LAALAELGRNLVWIWFLWRNLRALREKTDRPTAWVFSVAGLSTLAVLAVASHIIALFYPTPAELLDRRGFPALFAVAGMVLVEQFYRNSSARNAGASSICAWRWAASSSSTFICFRKRCCWRHLAGWLDCARRGECLAGAAAVDIAAAPRQYRHEAGDFASHGLPQRRADGLRPVSDADGGSRLLHPLRRRRMGCDSANRVPVRRRLVLLLAVFSSTVRAKLRVIWPSIFFRYRYDYREEWLRFTSMLTEGEPDTQVYDRSLQAMARLVDSPAARSG